MNIIESKTFNIEEWEKKQKSDANILGYQPKFELVKVIYETICSFSLENEGILKPDLYKLLFQGELNENDYKNAFEGSLNFLDQVNFIDTYKKDDLELYNCVKQKLSLNFELDFFHLISKLKGLSQSPYILYRELIRERIFITNSNKIQEFSVSIQNKPIYDEYNINPQQISYWMNLYDNLGAITRIGNNIFLLPDYENCFNILKYFYNSHISEIKKNKYNIKIEQVIQLFEKKFYPILVNNPNNPKETHKWFDQFIECLRMRNIIDVLLIDDSEAYTINKRKISNIQLKIEELNKNEQV